MVSQPSRYLFVLPTVASLVLLVGCTFDAQQPKVFACSALHPECPPGTICHPVRRECVPPADIGRDASPLVDRRLALDGAVADRGPVLDTRPGADRRVDGPVHKPDKSKPDVLILKPDVLIKPDGGCVAPLPPPGVNPSAIVSNSVGSDTTTKPLCIPFRTIPAALGKAVAGQTIWVAPGTYDGPHGESSPLTLPDGVALVGDEGAKGVGATATTIGGTGLAPSKFVVSLVQAGPAGGGSVRGFFFTNTAANTFAIDNNGLPMAISSNTFAAQNGLTLFNAGGAHGGCPTIIKNTFKNSGKGVYSQCGGSSLLVDTNTFSGCSMGIYITQGNGTVRGNIFLDTAVGVQIDFSSPLLDANTFSRSSGSFAPAAIVLWGATPRVRNSSFNAGPAISISEPAGSNTANPDLGTALDNGKNNFTSIAGTVVVHNTAAKISAIENQWQGAPCQHVLFTAGGQLIWGIQPANVCP
jgi:hypothetical protein